MCIRDRDDGVAAISAGVAVTRAEATGAATATATRADDAASSTATARLAALRRAVAASCRAVATSAVSYTHLDVYKRQ